MKRLLALLAFTATASVTAAHAESTDPIGDVIGQMAARVQPILATFGLKATLYHSGARGVGERDSLGCRVIPMRTAAVDGKTVPRHSLLYIKETVGLMMPDGHRHDGYWYATDVGGGIRQGRIDLFTGRGPGSMAPMMALNLATLTVSKVGEFAGCPSAAPPPAAPAAG